jgi:hypothetical protein
MPFELNIQSGFVGVLLRFVLDERAADG